MTVHTHNSVIQAQWDCNEADTRLGNLLIFVKELLVLSNVHQSSIEAYFYDASVQQKNWIRAVMSCVESVDTIYWLNDKPTINDNTQSIFWPTDDVKSQCSWCGSTRWLQKMYVDGIQFPKFERVDNVPVGFEKSDWNNCIAVHLKNSITDSMSNASLEHWMKLFNYALIHFPDLRFLIIGDDDIPIDVFTLNNVLKAGNTVSHYLSVLENAPAFMGMSSGFCNYAILESMPYRIWKQPGHHSKHINQELNSSGQFSFAGPNQKFIIGKDSADSLIDELNSLLNFSLTKV